MKERTSDQKRRKSDFRMADSHRLWLVFVRTVGEFPIVQYMFGMCTLPQVMYISADMCTPSTGQ
jgi:hypothetical protein